MSVFDLRFPKDVIAKFIGLYLLVLFVLYHDLVPAFVEAYLLLLPDLQVETAALALPLDRLSSHLRKERRLLLPFGQGLQMVDNPQVELYFLLSVEVLYCVLEVKICLFLPFFKLVKPPTPLIKLCMYNVLTVIQPDIQLVWTLYLASDYLFIPEVLKKVHDELTLFNLLLTSINPLMHCY